MKRVPTLYVAMLLSAVALMFAASEARAQYPRMVLLEEFTSATCKPCTTATPIINKLLREKNGRVVAIRYHMNFPVEGDIWFEANRDHNRGRAQYYGVVGLPYGRIDGATSVGVTSESDVFDKAEDKLAEESPIKLEVTQTRAENQFNVEVKATAGSQGIGNGYKIHVVAVESHIHDERFQGGKWNNEKDFDDVMRTLAAGLDGQEFTIDADAQKTMNFSYMLGEGWQADQMYAVVFVQNEFTQQVVQAAYSVKPVSGVEAPAALAGYALESSFPNPARTEASIGYQLGAPGNVTVELHNVAGALLATYDEGTREAGPHRMRIDLSSLPAGVYSYTIHSGSYRASRMMTVVK